ncbi:MAG: siroheme synthase CysG [Gammaproteobacteria bacterium]
MDYLPVFLNLKNRRCLVVGGGNVADRKISLLLNAGAEITVIAPEFCAAVQALHENPAVELRQKAFAESDMDGFCLAVAATDEDAVNRRVSASARDKNVPVNVVDDPKLCSFIFPAIVDRSPVIAAVSSGGASPVLSRLLRARIESLVPAGYGRLAQLAANFRSVVKARIADPARRRIFWENVLQGPVAEQVFAGKSEEAEAALKAHLECEMPGKTGGEVYLVGAGPGDPDLLTFRALRLLQQADVVVYDRLVSPAILELARRDAERIYVGKQRLDHTLPQESINSLLVELAKQGKRVARLKGGDPFIFGRGGEEIETLAGEGVNFQIVPGITAASGCASYAGIPLTHRDHAQTCIFVTGHLKDGTVNLNWKQLAAPNQTVVIYMGLHGLETICQNLMRHGAPGDRPIALIQEGTRQTQQVLVGTLESMPDTVEAAQIKAPTIIIVGTVVCLRKKLAWFQEDLA